MFYGSDDIKTCMIEIDKKNDCSIGKWEILEDIMVYDLTYKFFYSKGQYFYKNFPSIFDKDRRNYYHDYKFILDFASDICRKVIKNRDENIDYVPTQIVIEYFKLTIKSLNGISFFGAGNGQKNYCLFLNKKQCLDGSLIKMIDSFYVK
ncbi:MAG: hypothetical protein FWC19_10805 [Treponema sp.]|nr:hypothetical protein [Treponema sp.]